MNENVSIWDCIITRKLSIDRIETRFLDYTDWLSEGDLKNDGRLDTILWGDYILVLDNQHQLQELATKDGELIEEVKPE